jgi:hypothetical protein
MAKSITTSAAQTPIDIRFDNLYDLEHVIDALTELLQITEHTQYSRYGFLRDELIEARQDALKAMETSCKYSSDRDKYKVSTGDIVKERNKGEAA